jgi:hypothetical protein
MEIILTFTFKYLEYIVAGLGGIGIAVFIKSKHITHNSNDLTSLIIKQKKYNESVNKRSKSGI